MTEEQFNELYDDYVSAMPEYERLIGAAVSADAGKYSYVGKTTKGIEVYETSEEVQQMPYKKRMETFIDIMRDEYSGRTAKFSANGDVYYAKFDAKDLEKNVYGDKKSSPRGWKAKINTGADGNIFELMENSQHHHGKAETGKKNAAHIGVAGWEYFVKTVQIDGRVYDLLAYVRKKPDGEFIYSIQLNENNKTPASPVAVFANSNPALSVGEASTDSVADDGLPVKGQFSISEPEMEERGAAVSDDPQLQVAVDMLMSGKTPSEIFNATGKVVMSNGNIYSGIGGDLPMRAAEYKITEKGGDSYGTDAGGYEGTGVSSDRGQQNEYLGGTHRGLSGQVGGQIRKGWAELTGAERENYTRIVDEYISGDTTLEAMTTWMKTRLFLNPAPCAYAVRKRSWPPVTTLAPALG